MQGVGAQERCGGGNRDLRARGRLRAYERPPAIGAIRSHRGGSLPPALVLSTPQAGHDAMGGGHQRAQRLRRPLVPLPGSSEAGASRAGHLPGRLPATASSPALMLPPSRP